MQLYLHVHMCTYMTTYDTTYTQYHTRRAPEELCNTTRTCTYSILILQCTVWSTTVPQITAYNTSPWDTTYEDTYSV